MSLQDYIDFADQMSASLMQPLTPQGNSQQKWEAAVAPAKPQVTPGQYFRATGRIFTGGTGDIPVRNASGNITGYAPRNRSAGGLTPGLDRLNQMQADSKAGKPLASASGTPGLDALYKANPLMGKPGSPRAVAGTTQFGPTMRELNPLVVKKRTDLPAVNTPAANTQAMMNKIIT